MPTTYTNVITALETTGGPTDRVVDPAETRAATGYVVVAQDDITVDCGGSTVTGWPISQQADGVTITNLRVDTGDENIVSSFANRDSGTAASTNGTSTVDLSGDTPDLSAVVVGDILTITGQTVGRGPNNNAFVVTAVDDGADTVTVIPNPSSATGQTWTLDRPDLYAVGADGLLIFEATGVTVDQCSFTRASDELTEMFTSTDSTIKRCLMFDPINEGLHPSGTHGMGMNTVGVQTSWTGGPLNCIENVFMNCKGRHPSVFPDASGNASNYANGHIHIRVINNVIYNPKGDSSFLGRLGSRDAPYFGTGNFKIDYIGNVIILTDETDLDFLKTVMNKAPWTDLYQSGNFMYLPDGTLVDMWEWAGLENESFKATPNFDVPVSVMTDAKHILRTVTNNAGATPANRHADDQAAIDGLVSYCAGIGLFIDRPYVKPGLSLEMV
jgi:hypothetical protein